MILSNEKGEVTFSKIEEDMLYEAIDERVQLTDVGTKKHRDYTKLFLKIKSLIK